MSYGGYNNPPPSQQQQPYANPYASRPQGEYGAQYRQQGGYDVEQGRANGGYGGYGGGNDVEMRPYNAEAGAYGQAAGRDPNAILNECKELDRGIDSIGHNLERLRALQRQSLEDTDASPKSQINREIDSLNSSTMTMYRSFGQRIKAIKQQPESGDPRNAPQVGRVDRKLKTAINEYQQVERDFRLKLQAQMERQYRIVRPDATDAEVREACEDATSQQVFSQALLQSDRRGQAQTVLRDVESRHQAIQKIERQMIELAELFQDVDAAVIQQEPAVTQIEQKGEEVTQNTAKANTEIDGAIVKARSRNRKKWWCLLICLLIIIIIVVVVVVAVVITNNNKPK